MSHHTFVLSRRVGRALPAAEAALPIVVAYRHGDLRFVGQFQRRWLLGPWGSGPPERHAPAELRTGRHTLDRVEVEVGPWARHAVEVRLRPVAHRPERWSGRRQQRYFDRAHTAIDELARALEEATPAPPVHLPVTRSARLAPSGTAMAPGDAGSPGQGAGPAPRPTPRRPGRTGTGRTPVGPAFVPAMSPRTQSVSTSAV